MPRITRAQSMDVLSSQANLAGYKAVIDAAAMFEQAMPMMMTAAGTVPAAKVFIMGAGVAGPAGDRHGAPPRRAGLRHRRAPRGQGAGRLARRQVHRGRGRGVQAGADGGRLRQAHVGRVPGQAGRARRRPHQEPGHRRDDGADPRAAGAAPRHARHGREHEARRGHRRSRRRARRQRRAHAARQDRRPQRRAHLCAAQSRGRGRRSTPRASTPRTSSRSSRP